MMKTVRFAVCLGVLLAAFVARVDALRAAQRVLLIGDETVVDSAVEPYGFTNELRNVMANEGREVAVPTRVKEGRNILVARVDRTQWDRIVGFTILDEEGRPLKDSNPFYEEN